MCRMIAASASSMGILHQKMKLQEIKKSTIEASVGDKGKKTPAAATSGDKKHQLHQGIKKLQLLQHLGKKRLLKRKSDLFFQMKYQFYLVN